MIEVDNLLELNDEQLVKAAIKDMATEEAKLTEAGWDVNKDEGARLVLQITCENAYRDVAWAHYFRDKVHPRLGNWLDASKTIKNLTSRGFNLGEDALDALITHPVWHVPCILAERQMLTDVELGKMLLRFSNHTSIWDMLFESQRKLRENWYQGLPASNFRPENAIGLMRRGEVRLEFMEQPDLPTIDCPWPVRGLSIRKGKS